MIYGGMESKFADVPDPFWALVRPLLPAEPPKVKGGRPRLPARRVLAGIVYRLKTGCQWKALPREFGSGATCHRWFQRWSDAGVFTELFATAARLYDEVQGIAWQWSSLDGSMVKAPKGGT
jgi:transposase